NGCDSVVQVTVDFFPLATGIFEPEVCEGQGITFNGTEYDAANPSGTEILSGAAVNGCDSVVTITLSFLPSAQGTFETTICENANILFNGTTYDSNNTMGTEILAGQAANGCDSIVQVTINFFPSAVGSLTTTICESEDIFFNGTTYDINNSSGTEILSGQAANGCDSVVNVQLNFFPTAQGNLDLTICETEDIIFNGTTYDINNPSGTETLAGQAANGCDSLVTVNLSFFPPAIGDFETTLCETDNIMFNGTTYDINNSSGTETLAGQAANGCDSIVNVQLSFFPPAMGTLDLTICEGENIMFNGTTYDAGNTSGTETLVGQSANGCDSIVTVNIDFFAPAVGDFSTEICPGSDIVFNGTTYDENNTSGTEILVGQSVNGCDSIVNVSITFSAPVTSLIEETFCSGAVLTVNGTDYDENNPSGTEVLLGAAANGCDSTIQINLQFITTVEVDRSETLCPGGSVMINGVVYDENNPSGTELIPGGGGVCDSLITIDLSFFPEAVGNLDLTICPDSEVNINGTIYDINNPSGVEVLTNASSNGCDSMLNVQLSFEALAANLKAFPPTCFGESNGTINIESLTGGQGPYQIALADGNFEPITSLPFNFGPLPSGDYQVRIRDVNDCEITQAITIPTPIDLQVSLGEDVSIRLGDSVQLQALTNLDGVTVSWNPSTDLSCVDCLEPIAKPLATTIYTVTVSNNGDCATSDDVRIIVDPDPPVYMANAFSPNGDGVNDFFTVQADGILQNIQYFGVFDRWGNLIFERNNFAPNTQENSWDGTYRLQAAPVGVYVYFVEILQPNGRLFKITGDVLLSR
ncbi:MAG: gliding motility-associated C-terminal domain-containing protein, partial [Saprospiraceae bacterium]|nr:gliding motility-associated C-terminal domain-containing protein [Saprospiraceae bacterium]